MKTDATRRNVPIDPDELAIVEAARDQGSPAYQALVELVGPVAVRSEAATLHAALSLGLGVIKERVAEHGYAALAASQTDEDREFHAIMRQRRRGGKD
jgi:hypothetical protein